MKILTFSIIIFMLMFRATYAGELALSEDFCNKLNGKAEVRLEDTTRVDCLTEKYAFEVDYAPKWAESVAQALHYANMTGKKPAIAIIIRSVKDIKYVIRLSNVLIRMKPIIHLTIINNY